MRPLLLLRKTIVCSWCLSCALVAAPLHAHDIIRHAAPNVPVATSVLVPAGSELLFVSGLLPDAADSSAAPGSIERFGDTAAQMKSAMGKLAKELEAAGLTMVDVVKLTVYVVGDPRKGGAIDVEGLMKANLQLYGLRAQEKNLPARTTVQVAGLTVPGVLVQVDAIAARHAAH